MKNTNERIISSLLEISFPLFLKIIRIFYLNSNILIYYSLCFCKETLLFIYVLYTM